MDHDIDHVNFAYAAGMDDEEVDRRLREAETGVLSLADGGEAYAVPLAYHYDGGPIVLRLVEGTLREHGDDLTDAEVNERFPALRVFGEEIDEAELGLYELVPDSITGRTTSG